MFDHLLADLDPGAAPAPPPPAGAGRGRGRGRGRAAAANQHGGGRARGRSRGFVHSEATRVKMKLAKVNATSRRLAHAFAASSGAGAAGMVQGVFASSQTQARHTFSTVMLADEAAGQGLSIPVGTRGRASGDTDRLLLCHVESQAESAKRFCTAPGIDLLAFSNVFDDASMWVARPLAERMAG